MKTVILALIALVASSARADYTKTPNQYVKVSGVRYAYRTVGSPTGIPLVLLQHWTGTMDHWDSELIDLLAEQHKLYILDNTGIGASGGKVPDNVKSMAKDAVSIIKALHLQKVDLLGFSLGGFLRSRF